MFLIAGISWIAHITHAVPYASGVPHRGLPGGQPGVRAHRRRADPVLPGAGGRHHDLVHRRQHQLQRLPVPDQLRGRGLVPAPLAEQARPPAGVLQRHHRAHHPGARPAVRRRREHQQPGPVLRDRRVHRVLHGRLRHGPLPPAPARAGLAPQDDHQPHRRHLHRAGRADLRGREVHRGRLAGGHRLPDRGIRVHPAEPAVPHRIAGPGEHRRTPRLRRAPAAAELHPPRRHRLRRRLRPGHPGRAAVRQEPAAHHGPRGALRHRQRAGRTAARRLAARPQRLARLHRLPRPQADPVRRRPGQPRGESARHPGDRDPAPAQLLGAARPCCCTTAPRTRSPAW